MITEYALSKHRFYELKHFCLQYPEWKQLYSDSDGWPEEISKNEGDTTSKDGITRAELWKNMSLILNACKDTGYEEWPMLFNYISGIDKVSNNKSELFFYYYRKFFWILSKRRK